MKTQLTLGTVAFLSAFSPSHEGQCNWLPDQTLVPSLLGGLPEHYFARSVSLDGDHVVVGAPGLEAEPGKAYVFELVGTAWQEQASFDSGQGLEGDDFGRSVAISDGIVLVGAPEADGGAVYVFELHGSQWVQVQEILPLTNEGEFGKSLDMETDRAVIAAPDAQSVLVYERADGVWSWTETLVPPAPTWDFGTDVDLDGDRIAVGSGETGFAFVYVYDGVQWELEFDAQGGLDEEFGAAVSLKGDLLLVGAPGWMSSAGRVYTYGFYASSWVTTGILSPSAAAEDARFGETIDHDLQRALIGAPADGEGFGSTFLFERAGTQWVEAQKFEPDLGVNEFNFGTAIAVDGGTAMINVGVDQAGVLGAQYAGSLYVYSAVEESCPGLFGYPGWISLSEGGKQLLSFETDPAYALHPYLVLGSLSGTSPGIPLGAGVLPLNPDSYFLNTILSANGTQLVGTFGLLSSSGTGTASISLPPGSNPGWAGLQLHHAFVVLDPATLSPLVSDNAVLLELIP